MKSAVNTRKQATTDSLSVQHQKKRENEINNETHHKQNNPGIMSLAAALQYLFMDLTRYHSVCGFDCSSV